MHLAGRSALGRQELARKRLMSKQLMNVLVIAVCVSYVEWQRTNVQTFAAQPGCRRFAFGGISRAEQNDDLLLPSCRAVSKPMPVGAGNQSNALRVHANVEWLFVQNASGNSLRGEAALDSPPRPMPHQSSDDVHSHLPTLLLHFIEGLAADRSRESRRRVLRSDS